MANSNENSRYHEEMVRLASFSSWPLKSGVCTLTLARVGFWYSGSDCVVFCWCCGEEFDANVYGINVKRRHKVVAPNCLCLSNSSSNVPLKLPTFLNKQMRNATETDHSKESSDIKHILEIVCQRASRRGMFEPNILKLCLSEPDFDVFRRELLRLATFRLWPANNCADPDALASAGFFYAGRGDTVRCAFCRNSCERWKKEDAPLEVHKKLFPDCPFVRNDFDVCANVPKEDDILDEEVQVIGDSSCLLGNDQRAAEEEISLKIWPTASRNSALEVQACNSGTLSECVLRPRHPDMIDVEARKQSFYKSSTVIPKGQNPVMLAEAGFYYYGPSDYCKCFFCDGGLKNWQEDDEPWSEHARWYPRCEYVKSKKGSDFILQTQNAKSARLQEMQPRFAGTKVLTTLGSSVDPREIKARLDSDMAKKIIGMGYSRELVQHVIRTRLETKGDDFPNAESLVEALLLEQDTPKGSQLTSSASSSLSSSANTNTVPKQGATVQAAKSCNSSQHTATAEASSSVDLQQSSSKSKSKNKKKKKKVSQSKTGNQPSTEKQTVTAQEETEVLVAEEENPDDSAELLEDMETSLLKENQLLREARTCKVCMENEVNIVFLPCGHLVCCQDCAPELRICAICRALIRGTVKTFLA